jgi:ATP-dependent Clp protease ATP-binding subunit ClpB
MNAQKYTQKSLETIKTAQHLALEHANAQMEELHLLLALLESEGGLIPSLLGRMGLSASEMAADARRGVESLPHVSGSGRQADAIYISAAVDNDFVAAERLAENMKDEYVAGEHLFLVLLYSRDAALQAVFTRAGLKRDAFLQALVQVRGNTRSPATIPKILMTP